MRGALVILIAMVIIGVLLFVTDVVYYRRKEAIKRSRETGNNGGNETQEPKIIIKNEGRIEDHGEFCCGKHLICEKTGLSPIDTEVIYYDDEELDRFKGRDPSSYTDAETEEFRDVLLTLLPQDVEGWARSITLREIELPPEVREELLMIVSDLRATV